MEGKLAMSAWTAALDYVFGHSNVNDMMFEICSSASKIPSRKTPDKFFPTAPTRLPMEVGDPHI